MKKFFFICLAFLIVSFSSIAQDALLTGKVISHHDKLPIYHASLMGENEKSQSFSDSNGYFSLHLASGKHKIIVSSAGYITQMLTVHLQKGEHKKHEFQLYADTLTLQEISIRPEEKIWEVERLNDVEGMAIYAGKKNEVITIDKINANTSTNNMRQLYSKVPGINVIENDAAGIQISVATRGLNPNRTSEFNSRQNGYDISADPIGYAESYFSPPSDALERIEIVRGAASLQYGSQFGGLLNFKYKRGAKNKAIEGFTKQTAGSYGFFNSFNSIGGTYKKLNYYTFYNYKRGDGWRENSGFGMHTGHASFKYSFNSKVSLGAEFTSMNYLMQQPGGLTDAQFAEQPRKSLRDGNWFNANWNMPAVTLDYQINSNSKLNIKVYGLIAKRTTIGNINKSSIVPDTAARVLNNDDFLNVYTEARLLKSYSISGKRSSLLLGVRAYKGNTQRQGGPGATGKDPNFDFSVLTSEFKFPSYNFAFFAENIFRVSSRFTITPGIRYEILKTNVNGFYNEGNTLIEVNQSKFRTFPLLGLGVNYAVSSQTNIYFNASQNYSPISFADIFVLNTSLSVDPKLKDVKGYNADLGYRGAVGNLLNFDVGIFYMAYKNRIGNVSTLRKNFSDSRNIGFEGYGELNILKFFSLSDTSNKINIFSSLAFTDARYVNNVSQPINNNKKVEFAPTWIIRSGLTLGIKKINATLQYSFISHQYSDATNARVSSDGITGLIPAYGVYDCSINYTFGRLLLNCSLNNLTNNIYYTRRAPGFPGPGIIPSEGRSVFVTLALRI